MGSGFSKMKKQARMMEEQYQKMREEMENKRVAGQSGNGLVTVTVNGNKEIVDIKIKPECVDPEDIEGLQDLIVAACKEAYSKTPDQNSSAGGFPFPF